MKETFSCYYIHPGFYRQGLDLDLLDTVIVLNQLEKSLQFPATFQKKLADTAVSICDMNYYLINNLMHLPIILANDEQNGKPFPKKARDACFAAWSSQFGQKAEYICGGIIPN